MSLIADIRSDIQRRVAALGWKGNKTEAAYTKPLDETLRGYIGFRPTGMKTGGLIVSLSPSAGLVYENYRKFEWTWFRRGRRYHPQIQRHPRQLLDVTRAKSSMKTVDETQLELHVAECLDALDVLRARYPTMREVLSSLPQWETEENHGGMYQEKLILGAAYLGDHDKAHRLLESARTFWMRRADESGQDVGRPLADLDTCERAIESLHATRRGSGG